MATAKIVLALSVIYLFTPAQSSPEDYKRMMGYLDSVSGPGVFPQTSPDTPVSLSINMSPMNILEANRDNNQVSMDTWLFLTWNSGITFDPANFNGISSFRVPVSKIWVPDLAVYNGDLVMSDENPIRQYAVLNSNGDALWVPPVTVTVFCDLSDMEVAANTTCSVKMGSWTFSGAQVTLNVQTPSTADYNKKSLFQLISVSAKREVHTYECCPEPYESMLYTFIFNKKS